MSYLTKQDIMNSSDGKCFYCGQPVGEYWHAEHKNPKSKGGRWEENNIVVSCPLCNLRKSNKSVHEFKDCLKIRSTKRISYAVKMVLELLSPYIQDNEYDEICDLWKQIDDLIFGIEITFRGER